MSVRLTDPTLLNGSLYKYVTLVTRVNYFFLIYTSPESWINKLSIDVAEIWNLRVQQNLKIEKMGLLSKWSS